MINRQKHYTKYLHDKLETKDAYFFFFAESMDIKLVAVNIESPIYKSEV